jgi:hypothetical protein
MSLWPLGLYENVSAPPAHPKCTRAVQLWPLHRASRLTMKNVAFEARLGYSFRQTDTMRNVALAARAVMYPSVPRAPRTHERGAFVAFARSDRSNREKRRFGAIAGSQTSTMRNVALALCVYKPRVQRALSNGARR